MREILFRGKRIDNGEWVEGVYYKQTEYYGTYCEKYFIITSTESLEHDQVLEYYEVIPETVGQYTGLTDKNGKRIFEGDVVAQNWYDFDEPADDSFGEVVFSVGDCSFSVLDYNKNAIMSMGQGLSYHWEIEIVGNIHDNPELLKGTDYVG